MTEFKNKIIEFENIESNDNNLIYIGKTPILLSSPHTIKQIKEDGTLKLNEPYTKAISLYISEVLDTSYIIKNKYDGVDPNSSVVDEYKEEIIKIIKENNITLLLDIHGASIDREFDIELGTLNNISADFSTINELKESFIEHGIKNVVLNSPFKGGGITKLVYLDTNIDVIQIEINAKYRDIDNIENLKLVISSIIDFIKQYTNK